MLKFIKAIWWAYVAIGAEQEIHNHEVGIPYYKPNLIYRIQKAIDKEFRLEMNECLAARHDRGMPRILTRWTERNH